MDTPVYTNVGNYNELTAVANGTNNVQNLLLHELGHYFGLNEEYTNGGTELVFASGPAEPWSQNLTFQTSAANIKWRALIKAGTPIPTPASAWTGDNIGAYRGGYGGLDTRSHVPVPDRVCIMSSGTSYCAVCRAAIADKVIFDLGEEGSADRSSLRPRRGKGADRPRGSHAGVACLLHLAATTARNHASQATDGPALPRLARCDECYPWCSDSRPGRQAARRARSKGARLFR
jgi:hypothetical protein